jgi:hypothetical protein
MSWQAAMNAPAQLHEYGLVRRGFERQFRFGSRTRNDFESLIRNLPVADEQAKDVGRLPLTTLIQQRRVASRRRKIYSLLWRAAYDLAVGAIYSL